MAALPYFPMYPTDFEAKAGHLTLEEDGAYNRLLRIMWMTPGCSVPDDPAWIARRMKVDHETYQRVVSPLIDEFMDCKNQRVFNSRLSEEYAKAKKRWVSAKINGKKGGRPPKALKENNKDKSNGLQSANRIESYLEPEPKIDKERETIVSPKKKKGCRIPADFEPDIGWAVRQGLPIERATIEDSKFRDYWVSQPGQKGVKLDWPATWRNWVRNALERAPPHKPKSNHLVDALEILIPRKAE